MTVRKVRKVAAGTLGPKLGEGLRIPLTFLAQSIRSENEDEMNALIRVPVPERGEEWRARWKRAARMQQLCDALDLHTTEES